MYRSFYNLKNKPFHTSSDPRFLWLGENHKEALATLKYGILDNKGFLLLTGDVGTGKTTLINTLVNSLGGDVIVATVLDPGLSRLDFFNYIANAFGMDEYFESKGRFLLQFSNFLHKSHEAGKKILLIIDESQRLDNQLLEEIRLLSNIEKQNSKLLNIFFVGQNEFNDMLHKPENRAVRQRLTLNFNLDPLSRTETKAYINHRLQVAGTDKKIFTSAAVDEIFSYTLGFPRQINIVCDLALLSGYVSEKAVIDAEVIRDCVSDLTIPQKSSNLPAKPPVFVPQQVEVDTKNIEESVPENLLYTNRLKDTSVARAKSKRSSRIQKASIIFLLFAFILLGTFVAFPQLKNSAGRFISVYLIPLISGNTDTVTVKDKPDNKPITASRHFASQSNAPLHEKPLKSKVNKEQDDGKTQSTAESIQLITPTNEQKTTPTTVEKSDIAIGEMKIDSSERVEKKISEPTNISQQSQKITDDVTIEVKPEIVAQTATSEIVIAKAPTPSLPIPREPILISFPLDSNDISDDQMNSLAGFTEVLIKNKTSKIIITGYSDSVGNSSYNLKISEFRANIVKSYFLGSGVSPSQITARGLGIENPVAANDTVEGRQANRRVEVEFERPPSP